jgi:hypothetical protein
VAAPAARHRAVVLGLDLIVELVADPIAQLVGQRVDVEAGREPLDQREQQLRVAQVGIDRLGDAGILDLDRHGTAVGRRRAVDLADRGRRERFVLEVGEHALERDAELVFQELLDRFERQRRDVVAQRGQRRPELLALGLRDRGEVDRRQDLADLHRRAAHLAELLDQLAGGGGGALARRSVGALVGAQRVGRAGARPAQALTGHEPAEATRPFDPRGGWAVGHPGLA